MRFNDHQHARVVLALAALGYVVVAGILSRHFLPVHIDEIACVEGAYRLIHGIRNWKSGFASTQLTTLASDDLSFNWNGRPLYTAWVGLWMWVLPIGWWFARFASLAAGVSLLCFSAETGWQIGNSVSQRIHIGLLFLQPTFWMSSTVINELIITAC